LVVSVDGTSSETYSSVRSGADLGTVRENVRGFHRAALEVAGHSPEVGLEFVITRRNVADLAHLGRLARSMGACFVVVSNLLPCTESSKEEIIYWLSTSRRRRSWLEPEIMLPPFDARPEYLQPLIELMRSRAVSFPGHRLDRGEAYCRFVNEGAVTVAWNGEVSPCIALMHSYHCFVLGRPKTIRRYSLGNVGQQDIEDIWSGGEYARFRERVVQFDFSPCVGCGGCVLAESNEEDCFGNTFPVCGDCLWARGIMQCP
jgi:MoaA/NifB/PqqE/SkfB family radical SAM enzyme